MALKSADISFDLEYWIKKHKTDYDFDAKGRYPEYIDENGIKRKETSPYFETISKTILKRGFMYRDEFISIGYWKTQRQLNNYKDKSNSEDKVKETTRKVIQEQDTEAKVRLLINANLKGVKIAVASAILTILHPEKYCIIDYRAWRAMLWLKNSSGKGQLVLESYDKYADYLDSLDYKGVDDYFTYLKSLNLLFAGKGKTLRQIEGALWKFDQMKGKKNMKQKMGQAIASDAQRVKGRAEYFLSPLKAEETSVDNLEVIVASDCYINTWGDMFWSKAYNQMIQHPEFALDSEKEYFFEIDAEKRMMKFSKYLDQKVGENSFIIYYKKRCRNRFYFKKDAKNKIEKYFNAKYVDLKFKIEFHKNMSGIVFV